MNLADQGWGNIKGQVDFKLCRGYPDMMCTNVNEWNPNGSGLGSHVVYREVIANADHVRRTVNSTLDSNSKFVSMFQPGDYYELYYKVGGGGGHQLFIDNASIV